MKPWRAGLAALLSALLPASSAAPAWAAERAISVVATNLPAAGVSVRLPDLPQSALSGRPGIPGFATNLVPSSIASPTVSPAAKALIYERQHTMSGHSVLPADPKPIAGVFSAGEERIKASALGGLRSAIADGAGLDASIPETFDGSAKRDSAPVSAKAAALGILAPAAVLGASHAALAHAFSAITYNVANGSSLIFPLPDIHRAFSHAHSIPPWRAALGAIGAALVGLMNATVLVKPFWGTMHVFIGLGLIAPFVIGRSLKKRGLTFAYAAPAQAAGSTVARLIARVRRDKALHYTLATGALLLAASAGIYFAALHVVPHLLAATFSEHTVEAILFAVQLLKAVFFAIVFAPDALDMFRGKKPHGFSLWLDLLFIVSTTAFVAWGVQMALAAPSGMIRRQYLVHAIRNLIEAVAATISVISLRRAARLNRDHK